MSLFAESPVTSPIMLFELRYALRRLARFPLHGVVIVLSLSVSLASVVTMLNVVDSLFFRPPTGVVDPRHVVGVGPWANAQRTTYPDYLDLRSGAHSYSDLGAFAMWDYTVRIGNELVPARGMLVSSTLLPMLGIPPALGRGFTSDEDHPGADPVALVSYRFWNSYMGGNRQAIGKTIGLGSWVFTVVGVLPRGFTAPDLSPVDVTVPITNAPWLGGQQALTSRNYRWVRIAGRLRPGVTVAQASQEATSIYRSANRGVPSVDLSAPDRSTVGVRPIVEARREPNSVMTKVSLWLFCLSVLVLLIACANTISVLLSRSVLERRDLAIQVALGGSRSRMYSRAILDVGLLVAPAALLAFVVSGWANRALVSLAFRNSMIPAPVDIRAVVVLATVTLFTAVACVVGPTARASRVEPFTDLASGTQTARRSHRRVLQLLLLLQTSLAVVLVSEAMLIISSLRNALSVDLGFDREHLLVADVDLHAAGLRVEEIPAIVRRILDGVTGLQGVASAGFTNSAVVPGFLSYDVSVPGQDATATPETPFLNGVTPDFLTALGVRLIRGRELSADDMRGNHPVALVSQRFSRLYWPGKSPLGACVKVGGSDARCADVIGVVSNRRRSVQDPVGAAEIYVPLGSSLLPSTLAEVFPGRELAIHVDGNSSALASMVRGILADAAPELTNVRVRTGDEYLEREFQMWRLGASVMGAFGVIAVALASLGVLGTSAYIVAQRTRELGIRKALGAGPANLAGLVFFESMGSVVLGLAIGIAVALYLSRFNGALAFGISPLDPIIYGAAGAALLLSSTASTIPPAIRALASDPISILRAE